MAQISNNLWSPLSPAPRTDSRFSASQLETALLCNTVSHWLGASLESALRTSLTSKTGSCCVSRLCPAWMRHHQPSLNEATKILLNTFRQRQNGPHFPDYIIKCIFLNENVWIPIKIHWNLFLRVQLTIEYCWIWNRCIVGFVVAPLKFRNG